MEKNPEKKEEYLIANNVLKLASELLKVCMNTYNLNILFLFSKIIKIQCVPLRKKHKSLNNKVFLFVHLISRWISTLSEI